MKNYNKVETTKYGKFYSLDDKLHRTDGPAIEYANGTKHYYINGNLGLILESEDQEEISWLKWLVGDENG